jgi:hypothetical protein
VRALLERGVGHAPVRRAIERLRAYGDWPLSDAPLATTTGRGRPRVVLAQHDAAYVLSPRGWQLMVAAPELDDVRLRLRRTPADSDGRGSPGPHGPSPSAAGDRRCVRAAGGAGLGCGRRRPRVRQLDIRISGGLIALSGPHPRALAGDLAGLIDPGGFAVLAACVVVLPLVPGLMVRAARDSNPQPPDP